MRWLKHLSTAHNDDEVDLLLEECGAEGYGAYWLIIEDIAGPMEAGKMEPSAIHSDAKWASLCRVHHLTWKSLKLKLGRKLLLITPMADGRVKIAAPNILKYKDEYSRKSGQTPALSRERADTEGEQRESRGRARAVPPESAPEKQPTDATAAALQRMHEKHPYPSNPLDALYQFQRTVETAVNPEAVRESAEKNHAAWCEYWRAKTTQEGRAPWIPTLAQFFTDGYHAKMPPIRDGPAPVKQAPKSKSERDADAAREQFERLSRERSKANEPRVSANR